MKTVQEIACDKINEFGSIRKAAKAIGISHTTLFGWTKGSGQKRKSSLAGIYVLLKEVQHDNNR